MKKKRSELEEMINGPLEEMAKKKATKKRPVKKKVWRGVSESDHWQRLMDLTEKKPAKK